MTMTKSQLPIPNRRTAVRHWLSVCGLCLVAFLLGCESGVEQYKPEPNVHCILRTNRSSVSLLAGMTLGYYDSVPDTNEWQGTSGVAVSIGHRGKVFILSAVADSAGYYSTDSLLVVPGDTYSLSATYLDGTKVSGTTVVPLSACRLPARTSIAFGVVLFPLRRNSSVTELEPVTKAVGQSLEQTRNERPSAEDLPVDLLSGHHVRFQQGGDFCSVVAVQTVDHEPPDYRRAIDGRSCSCRGKRRHRRPRGLSCAPSGGARKIRTPAGSNRA